MTEKILILGGSHFQIPVIKYARSAGYYAITCDYLPDNPGHKYADEYHNVSTTDLEGVLELARQQKVQGVLAYASDPAAATAAYVGNRLGLPANPYDAVNTLAIKDRFREFLYHHGFNTPRAMGYDPAKSPLEVFKDLSFPLMIKPADSSGSKGVSKIDSTKDVKKAVEYALEFSRTSRVIAEEYITKTGPQIGGEAFVYNGKLVFMCLGDQLVDPQCNPYVPSGMLFPSRVLPDIYQCIASNLQRLLDLLAFSFGGLNLEIMLDKDNRIYLMEIGPRTGGNFLPELMRYTAGFDIAGYSVECSLGHDVPKLPSTLSGMHCKGFFAYYAIHSRACGILHSIELDARLRPHVLEVHMFKNPGDTVEIYQGSNCTLGIVLLRFESMQTMQNIVLNLNNYISVNLDGGTHYVTSQAGISPATGNG